MKNYSICIVIILTMFCSCETSTKSYSLQELDRFLFRRNYFGADSLSGKALYDFMNRKPYVNYTDTQKESPFYKHFIREKVIENQRWNLAKFDTLPENFMYNLNNKEITVSVKFSYFEKENTNNYILTFKDAENLITRDTLTFEFPPDVIFSKMDLNKNGTDELYALYKNYAINGDNFELSIFELE
ncbi:hypothetical protein [uncultured Kordia sp.]|uniref:hypothetical protein n=1 Tax=uncultured Kordia sp. TaxID=507699 RepID=UPI0026146DE6|nr:hypothetical protein [uncultured Kordia sp.]